MNIITRVGIVATFLIYYEYNYFRSCLDIVTNLSALHINLSILRVSALKYLFSEKEKKKKERNFILAKF